MTDEQMNELRKVIPGLRITVSQPHPCCTHCKHLSETIDDPDDYHGMQQCMKNLRLVFGYSKKCSSIGPANLICDDHEYPEHYE
jgi:hypothetical protein